MTLPIFSIRCTHTGKYADGRVNKNSVFIADLDVGYEYQTRKSGCYVPVDGYVDVPVTARSIFSLQQGSIAKFIESGVITAEYINGGANEGVQPFIGWVNSSGGTNPIFQTSKNVSIERTGVGTFNVNVFFTEQEYNSINKDNYGDPHLAVIITGEGSHGFLYSLLTPSPLRSSKKIDKLPKGLKTDPSRPFGVSYPVNIITSNSDNFIPTGSTGSTGITMTNTGDIDTSSAEGPSAPVSPSNVSGPMGVSSLRSTAGLSGPLGTTITGSEDARFSMVFMPYYFPRTEAANAVKSYATSVKDNPVLEHNMVLQNIRPGDYFVRVPEVCFDASVNCNAFPFITVDSDSQIYPGITEGGTDAGSYTLYDPNGYANDDFKNNVVILSLFNPQGTGPMTAWGYYTPSIRSGYSENSQSRNSSVDYSDSDIGRFTIKVPGARFGYLNGRLPTHFIMISVNVGWFTFVDLGVTDPESVVIETNAPNLGPSNTAFSYMVFTVTQ